MEGEWVGIKEGAFEGATVGVDEGAIEGTEVGHPPRGSPTKALASMIVFSDEETHSRRMHKANA